MRNLAFIFSIGVHHPDFQVSGTNQSAGQQILVIGDLFRRFRLLRAVDDFLAVVGKEGAAVVAQFMRELANVACHPRSS